VVESAAYLRFIVLVPLAGTVFNVLLGRRVSRAVVATVACLAVALAFATSLRAFFSLPADGALIDDAYSWIRAGSLNVDLALVGDRLSVLMCLIVTGVGFLIHVYSIGYMSHDSDVARYFAYLNLFTASMLLLVLGADLPVMFIGWEGVGLCSYLLIGFWYEDVEKAKAGMKAFIVNRVGDAGFLLGMFLLFWAMSAHGNASLRFADINAAAPSLGVATATAVALLLFVGATGKSAQIPLFVWLPDAMAGPTPVSALIHAATMVTAGVYMIARLHGLYAFAPRALHLVATVGALTALFAATVAITQNDIKKVLAYSTISQLGYMFVGLGVGAYAAAIFHLMTHAFFKALLFLCAGSVIHAMGGEQDIRKMGGLRHLMPTTSLTFLVATLAIAGVPGLSGFFSKDEILSAAFTGGHYGIWITGVATAGLTAFYMTRLLVLTFYGVYRGDPLAYGGIHESPASMTIPLSILAVLAAVGGYVGVPALLGGHNALGSFLEPVLGSHEAHMGAVVEFGLMASSVALALAGIWLAVVLYTAAPDADEQLGRRMGGAYRTVAGAYFVDALYGRVFVRGAVGWGRALWRWVDVGLIDALVNGTGTAAQRLSASVRRWATGNVADYAMSLLVGVVALVGFLVLQGLG